MVQYSQINKHSTPHKDKNHMIISIGGERAFVKVQHSFMIKTLSKVGIEGAFLNVIKARYDTYSQLHNQQEKLKSFPLRLGTRQGCLLCPFLFNTVLEVVAAAFSQEEEIKASKFEVRKKTVIICK